MIHTDRGDVERRPGRRRARLAPGARQRPSRSSRPRRRSRAGWRSIRTAPRPTCSCGSTRATCRRATAGRSPPATSCGSASAPTTRASTSRSRPCAWRPDEGADTVRYQGNWIPHRFRDGDRGRRVLRAATRPATASPMSAEGIRTAWYFGIAVRARAGRGRSRASARARRRWSATPRSREAHRWKFEWMWLNQRAVRHLHGRPLDCAGALHVAAARDPLAVPQVPERRAAGVRAAGAGRGAARAQRRGLADHAEHERRDDREHRQQDAGGRRRRVGALGVSSSGPAAAIAAIPSANGSVLQKTRHVSTAPPPKASTAVRRMSPGSRGTATAAGPR